MPHTQVYFHLLVIAFSFFFFNQSRAASRYYKVGQEILQNGVGNLLQSRSILSLN